MWGGVGGGWTCVHVVGMSVLILYTGLHWATVYKSPTCVYPHTMQSVILNNYILSLQSWKSSVTMATRRPTSDAHTRCPLRPSGPEEGFSAALQEGGLLARLS